jgi:AcrR family transcriptional regulator
MARDRRILDAAAQVFFERGFHGAGVDEIGRRAGLSGPAIYRHFSGKDEILAALFDEALDELTAATSVPSSGDPDADLERLVRHHVDFSIRQRQLVNVYQREDRNLVDPWRREFSTRRRAYGRRWEAAVEAVLPDTDPDAIAMFTQTLLGMVFSVAFWPGSVVRLGDPADRLVAFARSGLAGAAHVGAGPSPIAAAREPVSGA